MINFIISLDIRYFVKSKQFSCFSIKNNCQNLILKIISFKLLEIAMKINKYIKDLIDFSFRVKNS